MPTGQPAAAGKSSRTPGPKGREHRLVAEVEALGADSGADRDELDQPLRPVVAAPLDPDADAPHPPPRASPPARAGASASWRASFQASLSRRARPCSPDCGATRQPPRARRPGHVLPAHVVEAAAHHLREGPEARLADEQELVGRQIGGEEAAALGPSRRAAPEPRAGSRRPRSPRGSRRRGGGRRLSLPEPGVIRSASVIAQRDRLRSCRTLRRVPVRARRSSSRARAPRSQRDPAHDGAATAGDHAAVALELVDLVAERDGHVSDVRFGPKCPPLRSIWMRFGNDSASLTASASTKTPTSSASARNDAASRSNCDGSTRRG